MVNTTYKSSKNMINKLQSFGGKTKLKLYQNISIYYNEMSCRKQSGTFQIAEDPFSKGVESISKIIHEVLLLTKFL